MAPHPHNSDADGTPFLQRHRHLALILPAALVTWLAFLLFDVSLGGAADFPSLVRSLAAGGSEDRPEAILREARARYSWLAGAILFLVTATAVTLYCGWVAFHRSDRQRRLLLACAAVLLCAAGLAYFALAQVGDGALARGVYQYTARTLEAADRFYSEAFVRRVKLVLGVINALAIVAPVALVLAACGVLAQRTQEQKQVQSLGQQLRSLRDLLNAGALLLFTGILHMAAWLHWPVELISEESLRAETAALSLAITLYWGTTCSLVLAVTYVPAAGWLRSKLVSLLREQPELEDPQEWLREHGFSVSPLQYARQIGVILAPLGAAPISSALGQFLDVAS